MGRGVRNQLCRAGIWNTVCGSMFKFVCLFVVLKTNYTELVSKAQYADPCSNWFASTGVTNQLWYGFCFGWFYFYFYFNWCIGVAGGRPERLSMTEEATVLARRIAELEGHASLDVGGGERAAERRPEWQDLVGNAGKLL
jgi:hypothetical protein